MIRAVAWSVAGNVHPLVTGRRNPWGTVVLPTRETKPIPALNGLVGFLVCLDGLYVFFDGHYIATLQMVVCRTHFPATSDSHYAGLEEIRGRARYRKDVVSCNERSRSASAAS